jgi:hypothetical protein
MQGAEKNREFRPSSSSTLLSQRADITLHYHCWTWPKSMLICITLVQVDARIKPGYDTIQPSV